LAGKELDLIEYNYIPDNPNEAGLDDLEEGDKLLKKIVKK